MTKIWEVYALKYSERNDRTRADSFIFEENINQQHDMDYFIWLLRCNDELILVDTGYDARDAVPRQRPTLREPADALRQFGVRPEDITDLVITHLHYDHAGGLPQFPNATIHIQAAEVAYATGPCMCHDALRMPYTASHLCDLIQRIYSGRVVFYEGDAQIADGVIAYQIGGHSRGLQALGVQTESGTLCLASDASHYYENVFLRKPFPIVVDAQNMLDGFNRLEEIATDRSLIIPGHDPLVTSYFPNWQDCDFIYRLDKGSKIPFDL